MRFGGIVLVALLTLGACSSDPAPKEPKPSPTPTSPTPTATAPSMPPQAKQDTPSGAANFVKHYVDLVNFAANTGHVGPMKSASRRCQPCDSYAAEFAKPPVDGERFGGVLWRLKDASVSRTRSPLEVGTEVSVREGRSSRRYRFTFVLTSTAPFSVRDIYILEGE